MKNRAYDVSSYVIKCDKPIHVDANILIYLHPPMGVVRPEAVTYGAFISRAKKDNAKIRVSILVIGEYVNTYARMVFNSLFRGKYGGNFKSFRSSTDWPSYATQIGAEVNSILSYCEVQDVPADNPSIRSHVEEFSTGQYDFNDQLIVHSCELDSADLLTNDSDITEGGISVITGNTKLIAACS
jgi:hypothetical protein